MENIYRYVIWWHCIPTKNSGDSYGHKLCSTYSRIIFILLREGFYVKPPEVQTVLRHIDKFNNTSRYLGDIFTIDNPEFPRELQLNKANTSDKETSFLDLNIKVIGSNIHTSVYEKRDDFGFPIVNFPLLSGDVPDSRHTEFIFRSWFDLLDVVLALFYFHSKNLQITSKLLTQGYRYHKLRKTFEKFFMSYSELLSKFGAISFQNYVSQGITHPVFYGDLVFKLRRVKGVANFISLGSKIVKRLRRCQFCPAIIERTIGFVLGPFTALYRSFLKRCTLTRRLWLYDGPCLNLLRGNMVLIPVPSDC